MLPESADHTQAHDKGAHSLEGGGFNMGRQGVEGQDVLADKETLQRPEELRAEPGPRRGHTGRGLEGREHGEPQAEKWLNFRLPGAVVAGEKGQGHPDRHGSTGPWARHGQERLKAQGTL